MKGWLILNTAQTASPSYVSKSTAAFPSPGRVTESKPVKLMFVLTLLWSSPLKIEYKTVFTDF